MTARKKEPRLVITFGTQTDAMRMEAICPAHLGRIIPTPQTLSAGCGLAWMAQPEQRGVLVALMRDHSLAFEAIAVVALY